ncbi:hypothetical protein LOAG_05482 [Loa loa]|uniref:Uncharacterized protein n=1 Tax=Loa loa TaxID=7209 RepID=A0A1S0U0P3_LOALO|nr:hypothetical protein LOAG_05482 [Loa loa]EFO23003.1 hypothetical protein LOAG_05482 [Loa loa]
MGSAITLEEEQLYLQTRSDGVRKLVKDGAGKRNRAQKVKPTALFHFLNFLTKKNEDSKQEKCPPDNILLLNAVGQIFDLCAEWVGGGSGVWDGKDLGGMRDHYQWTVSSASAPMSCSSQCNRGYEDIGRYQAQSSLSTLSTSVIIIVS